MIEHLNFQQFTCFFDLSGKFDVGLAGAEISRGMVMRQNNSAREPFDRKFKNDFWICYCSSNSALADLVFFCQAVRPIDKKNPELLMGDILQMRF